MPEELSLSDRSLLFVCGGAQFYGVEAATLSLMKLLAGKGAAVHCFASSWNDGRLLAALSQAGIAHTVAECGWLSWRNPSWTIAALSALRRSRQAFVQCYNSCKPNVVVHSSYRSVAFFFPVLNRNNLLWVHDQLSASREARFLLPRLGGKIASYLACSEFIAEDLSKGGVSRQGIHIFRNFSDLRDSVEPRPESVPVRVGVVGRVAPDKGHAVLIDALTRTGCPKSSYLLKVFGEGADSHQAGLRRLAERLGIGDRVEFCGFASDKREIYRSLDIVVVPSVVTEAFGLAALEPAAFGLPVLASSLGGLPEVVADQETGYLFPPGDAQRLGDLLGQLIRSPAKRRALGEKGRERFEREFSPNAALARFCALPIPGLW